MSLNSIYRHSMIFNSFVYLYDTIKVDRIMNKIIAEVAIGEFHNITVSETMHKNFNGFPLVFDVFKYIGMWGTITPIEFYEIQRNYTLSFLDKHLKAE